MRRSLYAVIVLAVLAWAAPAQAITYGEPDGNGHPNVGGLVSPGQYSDGTWIYCSGTLISPTVFLTAAHCAEDGERVAVTFDPAYEDGDKVYEGTFHADPLYGQRQSDPHDIAVVVFDKPVKGIAPATLPTAGSLSGLSGSQTFTSVGYGAYEVTNGPGGHQYLYDDVRHGRDRHAELGQPELAAHLDEPGDRQRRHVLRRLGRPELPRGHGRDRRDHDHRRRDLPLHERRLPARHGSRRGRSSGST